MNEYNLDLLVSFIIREKRYLKKRETSFTDKELREGEDTLKKFIKVVQARKYEEAFLKEAETNPNRAKKIVRDISGKVKALSKKQLLILVQNYALIYAVIEKKHKEHKTFVEAMKADKFYSPRRKVY
ncbi:MAG TPA: hypothetical protein VJI13_00885 [Candidatus Norongarragalinales archaeon]|nr:hypothetical protein [Candidatus Norongarragalinales archaeon]